MTLRAGHGRGRGRPRIEVLPADEQPAGLPAPASFVAPPAPDVARSSDGRFADRQAAGQIGRLGGLAKAARDRQLRALQKLGLNGAAPQILAPFLEIATEFATAEVERLARECGAGVCSPNAAALVMAAARAMAGSTAAYASGDIATGARIGAEIRSNLLAARELTVRDAQARPKPPDWTQQQADKRTGVPPLFSDLTDPERAARNQE